MTDVAAPAIAFAAYGFVTPPVAIAAASPAPITEFLIAPPTNVPIPCLISPNFVFTSPNCWADNVFCKVPKDCLIGSNLLSSALLNPSVFKSLFNSARFFPILVLRLFIGALIKAWSFAALAWAIAFWFGPSLPKFLRLDRTAPMPAFAPAMFALSESVNSPSSSNFASSSAMRSRRSFRRLDADRI